MHTHCHEGLASAGPRPRQLVGLGRQCYIGQMIGILLRTLINALGIWLAAYIVPGVSATSTTTLIWAAIALGLINAFVRPVLVLLTLPFTILTLGLFLLVLNAGMLNLAGWFVDGFQVVGFWSAVFGAIVVSLVSGLCSNFIGPKGSYEVMVVRREG
jgi:putative membrane protein